MGLFSYINVHNTCLHILRNRGFELEVRGEPEPDGNYPATVSWIARKGDFYFCADNPIELLGLTAIYDYVQPTEDRPYWWRVDGPDIWEELMERAFPDESDQTKKKWQSTLGMFTGDPVMKEIQEEGRKIREAERE